MKRSKYLTVLSILAALILALVAVVPASADKPVHETNTWDVEGVWSGEEEDNFCGVDLNVHQEGKMEYFVWFDRNGEPYADTQHAENKVTFWIDPERKVDFHYAFQWRWTWLPNGQGLSQVSGVWHLATIPGLGVVFGTLGRQEWLETCYYNEEGEEVCGEDFSHLPGMVFNDPETVCNYLINGE